MKKPMITMFVTVLLLTGTFTHSAHAEDTWKDFYTASEVKKEFNVIPIVDSAGRITGVTFDRKSTKEVEKEKYHYDPNHIPPGWVRDKLPQPSVIAE